MKTTKRILSVLLALALGLALGLALVVPAVAVTAKGGPNAPIITKEPVTFKLVLTPKFVGDTITLEIEAKLPDGVEGDLSYAWCLLNGEVIGTGPKLDYVAEFEGNNFIYARAINTYTDENGEEQIRYTEVDATVTFLPRLEWWEIASLILLSPILLPLAPAMMTFGLGGGAFAFLLLPVMAIEWLLNLFR